MNPAAVVQLIAAILKAEGPIVADVFKVVQDQNAVALFHKLHTDQGSDKAKDAFQLLQIVVADLQANPPAPPAAG